MIKVTIELLPYGMGDHAKKIGSLLIANDGTGDSVLSNYTWIAEDNITGTHDGVVRDHDHDGSVWQLIAKCLPIKGKG